MLYSEGGLRSLVFTLLLEEPEFRRLTDADGTRLVTDGCLRFKQDSAKDPSITLAASMRNYVNDVTARHTCEPGVWQRYVDALWASDEQAVEQPVCAELAENGSCIHSDHMAAVDAQRYRDGR